jgi:hypothetical protein
MATGKPCGLPPVGSIIASTPSDPHTPVVTDEWCPMNGQVYRNGQSVYNGDTQPNLNGAVVAGGQYLIGGSVSWPASGYAVGNATHNHEIYFTGGTFQIGTAEALCFVINIDGMANASNLPPSVSVVWIRRMF